MKKDIRTIYLKDKEIGKEYWRTNKSSMIIAMIDTIITGTLVGFGLCVGGLYLDANPIFTYMGASILSVTISLFIWTYILEYHKKSAYIEKLME